MRPTELRESDGKGRVTLPRGWANCVVLVERVSDVEVVIRKAKVVPLTPEPAGTPPTQESTPPRAE